VKFSDILPNDDLTMDYLYSYCPWAIRIDVWICFYFGYFRCDNDPDLGMMVSGEYISEKKKCAEKMMECFSIIVNRFPVY
jgi:hypothetical protein